MAESFVDCVCGGKGGYTMPESEVIAKAKELSETIAASETYKNYAMQRDILRKQPELYEKVNEYRRRNFALQNEDDSDNLYEKMEAFERELEKFRENPLVDDFLRAELAFCRMMQSLSDVIMEDIDFE
jgi:cell fate (sporulation/competence/biofilm development) regulator YlbF (YheA/YmcA/DUF963 family)